MYKSSLVNRGYGPRLLIAASLVCLWTLDIQSASDRQCAQEVFLLVWQRYKFYWNDDFLGCLEAQCWNVGKRYTETKTNNTSSIFLKIEYNWRAHTSDSWIHDLMFAIKLRSTIYRNNKSGQRTEKSLNTPNGHQPELENQRKRSRIMNENILPRKPRHNSVLCIKVLLCLSFLTTSSLSHCRNPGEDTKMLVCDMCDKGYHTFCLQPAMDSLPTNGWRCKVGRKAHDTEWPTKDKKAPVQRLSRLLYKDGSFPKLWFITLRSCLVRCDFYSQAQHTKSTGKIFKISILTLTE